MKILSVEQLRKADEYTIEAEPIASINLMERAAYQCFKWFKKNVSLKKQIFVFCGPGNNGGDGLALVRMLFRESYCVNVFIADNSSKTSEDFSKNLRRLENLNKDIILSEMPEINEDNIIIDAIFGSGLSKKVKGKFAEIINLINQFGAKIISIDIPSGLFADKSSLEQKNAVIVEADIVLSFQNPKLCFMMQENKSYVKDFKVLDIGLHPEYLQKAKCSSFYLTKSLIKPLLKKREKFSHKGNYGHSLLIAGSYGKMGACILAAKAVLCSGVGLLTCHIPKKGNAILQTSVPEAMLLFDDNAEIITTIPKLNKYDAVAIGPGIGTSEHTQNALKLLIQNVNSPIIFDADALNILSENKTWLSFLARNSILTPHPKEFERLTKKWNNDFEKTQIQKNFSVKYSVYVILKGAHTCISTPNGICYFNSTGNSGMATAGSGDVLTGILLGLLSQNYSPLSTCLLGVYLHGLSGDYSAKKFGEEAMIASDIVSKLFKAFKSLK